MIGYLTAYIGPMFASKTTTLINRAMQTPRSVVIKISYDCRYAEDRVVSHDGLEIKALSLDRWNREVEQQYNSFFFDEYQFFQPPYFQDDFVELVHRLLHSGKDVTVAGLDLDFRGKPFANAQILAMASETHRLTSRCTVCNGNAARTFKLSTGHEAIEIGGEDKYEARCHDHWTYQIVDD